MTETMEATKAADWPECLDTALMKAQREFPDIPKDKINKFYDGQPYSSLDAIVSVTRAALAKYGLVARHKVENTEDGVRVTAVLKHVVTKEIEENALSCRCDLNNPQRIGGAITYLRRYTIAPLLGVTSDEDDDGNGNIPEKGAKSNDKPANGQQRQSAPAKQEPAAKPGTFQLPPGWPNESTVEQLQKWVDALALNFATWKTAYGVLTANTTLTHQCIEEWEPVFNHFGKSLKAIQTDATKWNAFARGVSREDIDAFVQSLITEKGRIETDKQSREVFSGETPAQGSETNGENQTQ